MNLDQSIALGVATIHLVLTALVIAPGTHALVLGTLIAVYVAVFLLGRFLSPRRPGMSGIAASLGGGLLIGFSTLSGMSEVTTSGIALMTFGIVAAGLLWSSLSWTPPPPNPPFTLWSAWKDGWVLAKLLCMIAAIPVLLASFTLLAEVGRKALYILWLFPAYFVAATCIATIFWFLQRISHRSTGIYLIGFLGAPCIFAVLTPVVTVFRSHSWNPDYLPALYLLAAPVGGVGHVMGKLKVPRLGTPRRKSRTDRSNHRERR